MKRILLLILALIIAVPVILIGKQFFDEDSGPPPTPSTLTSAQQIERGSYLARAGDCMACHTARGGKEICRWPCHPDTVRHHVCTEHHF